MIIKAPIDLELTQVSGQTSQPPWKYIDDSYSDLVCIDGEPSIFNVKQTDEYMDFTYTGNVSEKTAIENVKSALDAGKPSNEVDSRIEFAKEKLKAAGEAYNTL